MSTCYRYVLLATVLAAVLTNSPASEENKTTTDASKPMPANKMDMNEPMPTEMSRPGMKKGDVKNDAKKKERMMAPMIEQEEKIMQEDLPKK